MDARWLRTLGEVRLAGIVARRPEAATPAPTSLSEFAARLTDPGTVVAALRRLVLPSVQVAEAIAALRSTTNRPALDRLLGATDPATVAAVDRALADLTEHGLLATDGDTLILVPTVRMAWDSPLGLGPSVDEFLGAMRVDELRTMCSHLGVVPAQRRPEVIASLLETLQDGARLQSIVATAPQIIQDVLSHVVTSGKVVRVEQGYAYARPGRNDSPLQWATDRGLMMSTGPWSGEYMMPAEVTLALRGADYTAPFEPNEPRCARAATEAAAVARDCSAAGGAFLRLAARIVEEASRTRVATIRTGGVGVRELRRLAKACSAEVDQVRLALAALHGAGLLTTVGDGATPTEEYDGWLAAEPADRLAALIRAWWSLSYSPLAKEGGWEPSELDDGTQELRAGALRLMAAEPGSPTDIAVFGGELHWRHPYLLRGDLEAFVAVVAAWWTEATQLGVLGAGAISEAGNALLADDPAALAAALTGVGQSVRTAHLQADLTAVVAGTPSPELADLLNATADRESTGAASTWRFTPDSVRRGFDAGLTAAGLLAGLAEIASTGVPQTLTYLVGDVERRHGMIRASAVVCCLRSDDTALLAELAADRRLRGLGLRLLAPTVLAGSKTLAETMTALRKAGYAPVEESADGTAVVEATARRRAAVRPAPRWVAAAGTAREALASARRRAMAGNHTGDEALALARTLLGKPDGTVRAVPAPPPLFRPLLGDTFDDLDDDDPDGPPGGYPRGYPPYRPPFPRRRRY